MHAYSKKQATVAPEEREVLPTKIHSPVAAKRTNSQHLPGHPLVLAFQLCKDKPDEYPPQEIQEIMSHFGPSYGVEVKQIHLVERADAAGGKTRTGEELRGDTQEGVVERADAAGGKTWTGDEVRSLSL